ncbi:MAG TPA: cysteine--1-D-myo-inosityl 2-amino-2-deoxy-alpha-D-glucopyranoside ligase [Nocardioidaceae bacterium]|nr:cysteine--1-D-myo-inosityl 2-amino-2-deoxy-alpha-D-glucopyranoside ligase [Nocardioidaceae bacterium]
MRAWPAPDVPVLTDAFGFAPTVLVRDTASGHLLPTRPETVARLYVCGITPYDATHLGHAATYLAFDLLVRAWRDAGYPVLYVQNVTDVDDPLIERAIATGQDWAEMAERETALFRDDMTALRILPPDHFIGAAESIDLIAELIRRLRDAGAVYEVDGDLYFPVAADPAFGGVSNLDRAAMVDLFGERGGDPDRPGKKDPLDCLLWHRERHGEPAWDTVLGRGRPGWHIECTAIALQHLGMGFDVQGGGSDLAFPHHEMCASGAQVVEASRPFAQAYVHAGMVGLDGEKMSKSRGNLVFVSALLQRGVDPRAIRLALLDHHYRDDWEWTDGDLDRAHGRLERWTAAAALSSGPDTSNLLIDVRDALAHDLDAPKALVAVDQWAEHAVTGGGPDTAAPQTFRALVDARLGIDL